MCYVWIQAVTFALYTQQIGFVLPRWRVFTVRYRPSSYIKQTHFILKGLKKAIKFRSDDRSAGGYGTMV